VRERMLRIVALLGEERTVFAVGMGAKPCSHAAPKLAIARRGGCCEKMRRKKWAASYNAALSSLAPSLGYVYVPLPAGMEEGWAWADAIHLHPCEHERYVAHLAAALAGRRAS